jgi:hypothetical protein
MELSCLVSENSENYISGVELVPFSQTWRGGLETSTCTYTNYSGTGGNTEFFFPEIMSS